MISLGRLSRTTIFLTQILQSNIYKNAEKIYNEMYPRTTYAYKITNINNALNKFGRRE
jgi:hypothetical protein